MRLAEEQSAHVGALRSLYWPVRYGGSHSVEISPTDLPVDYCTYNPPVRDFPELSLDWVLVGDIIELAT